MPDTEAKLDAVLAKMDDLLAAKVEQETKLNAILLKLESLEISQKETAQDVSELKVIPLYCIAHPYCARFSRHQHAHMSACTCKT